MSKIFNLLPVGEEHAISLKALSAQTGLPERALRSQIVAELEDRFTLSFVLQAARRLLSPRCR